MKTKFGLLVVLLLAGTFAVNAQGGGQRRTVEERVQMTHQKIDSAFKLDATKLANVDSAFASYYRASDKARAEMMSGGGQVDRQAMQAKMQPLMDERDKKLATILTADQLKTWQGIEQSMRRPPRNN